MIPADTILQNDETLRSGSATKYWISLYSNEKKNKYPHQILARNEIEKPRIQLELQLTDKPRPFKILKKPPSLSSSCLEEGDPVNRDGPKTRELLENEMARNCGAETFSALIPT
jgi:hypothetical protein